MDDFKLEPPDVHVTMEERRQELERRAREIRGGVGVLFNQSSWELFLDLVEDGYTVEEINECSFLPSWSTIRRWIRSDPERRAQYRASRELSADLFEAQGIAAVRYATNDDYRLRQFQFASWMKVASKRSPKTYGDKPDTGEAEQAVEPMQIVGGLPDMPE